MQGVLKIEKKKKKSYRWQNDLTIKAQIVELKLRAKTIGNKRRANKQAFNEKQKRRNEHVRESMNIVKQAINTLPLANRASFKGKLQTLNKNDPNFNTKIGQMINAIAAKQGNNKAKENYNKLLKEQKNEEKKARENYNRKQEEERKRKQNRNNLNNKERKEREGKQQNAATAARTASQNSALRISEAAQQAALASQSKQNNLRMTNQAARMENRRNDEKQAKVNAKVNANERKVKAEANAKERKVKAKANANRKAIINEKIRREARTNKLKANALAKKRANANQKLRIAMNKRAGEHTEQLTKLGSLHPTVRNNAFMGQLERIMALNNKNNRTTQLNALYNSVEEKSKKLIKNNAEKVTANAQAKATANTKSAENVAANANVEQRRANMLKVLGTGNRKKSFGINKNQGAKLKTLIMNNPKYRLKVGNVNAVTKGLPLTYKKFTFNNNAQIVKVYTRNKLGNNTLNTSYTHIGTFKRASNNANWSYTSVKQNVAEKKVEKKAEKEVEQAVTTYLKAANALLSNLTSEKHQEAFEKAEKTVNINNVRVKNKKQMVAKAFTASFKQHNNKKAEQAEAKAASNEKSAIFRAGLKQNYKKKLPEKNQKILFTIIENAKSNKMAEAKAKTMVAVAELKKLKNKSSFYNEISKKNTTNGLNIIKRNASKQNLANFKNNEGNNNNGATLSNIGRINVQEFINEIKESGVNNSVGFFTTSLQKKVKKLNVESNNFNTNIDKLKHDFIRKLYEIEIKTIPNKNQRQSLLKELKEINNAKIEAFGKKLETALKTPQKTQEKISLISSAFQKLKRSQNKHAIAKKKDATAASKQLMNQITKIYGNQQIGATTNKSIKELKNILETGKKNLKKAKKQATEANVKFTEKSTIASLELNILQKRKNKANKNIGNLMNQILQSYPKCHI